MNNQSVKQDYIPKKENPFNEYFKIQEEQNLIQSSTNLFSVKYHDKILGEKDKEDFKETALETKLNQQLKGKDFKRRSSKFLSSKEITKIDNIRDSLKNIGVLSTKDNEEYLTIRKMPNIKEEQYYEMQNKIVDQKMLTNLYDYLKNINCNFKSQASGDSVGGISPLSFLIECFYGPNKEKAKEKKDKYKLLQTYIYNYRTISGDGNCYYRAVMFRYLEILILSNNIEFLRKLVYDIVQSFKSEELQKRKIILNSDIKPDLTFKILFLIIDLLKNNMIEEAHQILVKCFSTCKKFDYAIILYFRYILYDYIKKNENKIYLKSFPIKIGNLLPCQYETDSGEFLFNSFYENYLLKFFVDAEKIIIYLTPFVLEMELNIVIFDINDEDILQKFNYEGVSEIKNNSVISLLNSRNHYEIIYSKNENEQYKNFFEIYENHIESKNFLENDISIKKDEEEDDDEFKLLASNNKNLKGPKTVVGTKNINNIFNNNIQTFNNNNNTSNMNINNYNNPTILNKNTNNLKKNNKNKDNNIAHNNNLENNDINMKNKTNIVKNKDHDNQMRDVQKNNNNEKLNDEQNKKNQLNPKTNQIQLNKTNNKNNPINQSEDMNPQKVIIKKKNKNNIDNNNNTNINQNKNHSKAINIPQGDIKQNINIDTNTQNSKIYNIKCKLCGNEIALKKKDFQYCELCFKNRLFMYYINSFVSNKDPLQYLFKEKNLKVDIDNYNINFKNKLNYNTIINNIEKGKCLFSDQETNEKKYKLPCGCDLCTHFIEYFKNDKNPHFDFSSRFICKCKNIYSRIQIIKLGLLFYEINDEVTNKIIKNYFHKRSSNNCCFCNKNKNEVITINYFFKTDEPDLINEKNINKFINSFTHFCCKNCIKKIVPNSEFKCEICHIKHIITNKK